MENIVENKKCNSCGIIFDITDKDMKFYEKLTPVIAWESFSIPNPTMCPDCRQQRRYARRNERTLYKRKCDFSWENIISMYAPDTNFPVYQNKYRRWNDNDAIKYATEIDQTKTIFQQIAELQNKVPRFHRYTYAEDRMINSEYTNCTWDIKDCYLIFASSQSEKSYYWDYITNSFECLDTFLVEKCNNCYQSVDLENCHWLFYSQDCFDCSNSYYLEDCVNCQNCIWCIWLRNQNHNILNQAYSQEEYEIKKSKIIDDNWNFSQNFLNSFKELQLKTPKKYIHWKNNQNVVWDFINNSKNIYQWFDVNNAEDVKYCAHFNHWKTCMDFSSRGESELCYEITWWWDNMYRTLFSTMVFGCNNSLYLDHCFYCEDCFACVWLKHKKYCILNKQYSKQDYEKLVPILIERMKKDKERWELTSIASSVLYYNDTLAQDYFPLTPEEAKSKWYRRQDTEYPINMPEWIEKIHVSELPQSIKNIDDSILKKAIICETTGKPFRIIQQELEFYRKHNLPIPRKHPDQRHKERISLRNPRKLFHRKCNNCSIDMQTTYSQYRPEKVYCEKCYNKEIY